MTSGFLVRLTITFGLSLSFSMLVSSCGQKVATLQEPPAKTESMKLAVKTVKPVEKEEKKPVSAEDRAKAMAHVAKAEELKKEGKQKAAISELMAAADLDPEDVQIPLQIAHYFNGRGNFNPGYRYATRALEADPNNVDALLLRARAGFFRANVGDTSHLERQAVDDLKKARELAPNNPHVHFFAGIWKSEIGKKKEAIEEFTETLRIEPSNAEAYRYRAQTYAEIKEIEKALADMNSAIAVEKQNWRNYLYRAGMYEQMERYEDAYRDYTTLIDSMQDVDQTRFQRAAAAMKWRRYDLAVVDMNAILKNNPIDDEAFKRRADAYLAMGEFQKALADYNQAIEMNPDISTYLLARAKCFEKLGQTDKAAADRAKSKELKAEPAFKSL